MFTAVDKQYVKALTVFDLQTVGTKVDFPLTNFLFCLELSTSKDAVNSSSTFSASSASFYDGA